MRGGWRRSERSVARGVGPPLRSRPLLVVALYAVLAVLIIPVFPHFVSPNELSRWLLDASIVENGTIEVTRLAPLLGPSFEDLSAVGGRLYSNKAPGTNLLSLPGYLAARLFTTQLRPLLTAERLAAATLPLVLLAFLFIRLGKRRQIDDDRCRVVVWILLFATPLFAYGLLLFSHALVASALFAAWYFLHEEPRDLLAGALLGLAVAAEYPIVVPAVILVAPLVRSRRILAVIAGGAPFAIALGAYHTIAFGGPLRNPYPFSKVPEYQEFSTGGMFGIHLPSLTTAMRLLGDPTYGLFVFAPVLILAIPAMRTARSRMTPAAWWTLLLAPLSLLVLYAGYPFWHGGWNVGPRYLMPAVPFLTAPLLFAAPRKGWQIAEGVTAGASALATTLTTLVFPFVPGAFAFPWMSLALPLLGTGLVAPNLFHLVATPLALAVPFALVAFAAVVANRRNTLYLFVGALLALVVGFREQTPMQRMQRAYVAEVYFERRGSLPRVLPPGLQRRRAAELRLPPPPWPF